MKKSILFIAAAVALCACSKDELDFSNVQLAPGQEMIIANAAKTDFTRTYIDYESTNAVKVYWATGDQIKVANSTKTETYTLSTGNGSATAAFTGESMGTHGDFFCAYGASLTSFSYGSAVFTCPVAQSYTTNTRVDASGHCNAMAMIGKSLDDSNVGFNQVYSILRFKIYDSNETANKRAQGINSITINNVQNVITYTFNGTSISDPSKSGTATITYTYNGPANDDFSQCTSSGTAAICDVLVPAGTYSATDVVVNIKNKNSQARDATHSGSDAVTTLPGKICTIDLDINGDFK